MRRFLITIVQWILIVTVCDVLKKTDNERDYKVGKMRMNTRSSSEKCYALLHNLYFVLPFLVYLKFYSCRKAFLKTASHKFCLPYF